MEDLSLIPGTVCSYDGQQVTLQYALDMEHVVVTLPTGRLVTAPITALHLPGAGALDAEPPGTRDTYQFANLNDREIARHRLAVIEPLLGRRMAASELAETVHQHGISVATVRRWIRAYQRSGLPGLLRRKGGGKNRPRLDARVEHVLLDTLKKEYFTDNQYSAAYVLELVQLRCFHAGLPAPSLHTLRRRIRQFGREHSIRTRLGRQAARDQLAHPKPNTLVAEYPLQVVELDHTLLNIVLMDEETGRPLRRPWLTLALDVYSRMVVGFYLDFDVPGTCGTGLCLAHALLGKETWLAKRNIEGSWPCWGAMEVLHTDNAKEFRGSMLARACEQYRITPQFRPPRQPNHGGHIERFFRTLKWRVRHLPGAYTKDRRNRRVYRPRQQAVFTLAAFERWLATYIVRLYHHRVHTELGQSPLACYQQGWFGGNGQPARPLPPRFTNELQVQLDFMPFVERTIQRYGVQIEHFQYYDHVLSSYVYGSGEKPEAMDKRKYIFRVDPRDVSRIYFLDPDTHEYHVIPLADMSLGPVSAQTKRQALNRLRQRLEPAEPVRQSLLIQEIQELHEQEQRAQQEAAARAASGNKPLAVAHRRHRQEAAQRPARQTGLPETSPPPLAYRREDIEPFPNLDDGTSGFLYR